MQMCSYAYLTNIAEAELEDGWEMRHQGDFVIKVKVWKEVKRKSKHKRGDLKKTYEVIADHRCATYNIEKIPAYVIPMQGLREGTLSMMEYQIRDQQEKNVVDAMLYEAFDSGNLESNVVANYKKRKTGMPGDIEALTSKAAARRAKNAVIEEDEEDDYEEDEPVNDKPIKPKPTIQTKNSRGVAVENPSDSFYLTDGSTPTPHGAPQNQHSYGLGASSGGTPHATGATVGNISMVTKSKDKYGAPPPPSVPAYLAVPPDDELENAPKEVHKAYFPKSRSAGQSSDEGDGGHKAYFPPSRSGDSHEDHHKKKKDKKHKHKKDSREIELPAVAAPSPHSSHAPKSSHSAHSSAPSAYSYEGYEEDPYGDDYGGYAGGDYDDGGGVSGLV
jgi:hypothetical protein